MSCTSCRAALPGGARFCPSCGTPCRPPDPCPVPSGGPGPELPPGPVEARKVVTVLFCDLVGSTALSEALDPETLRAVTLRYFALMRGQVEEHGGTLEKFIGDAVMAVFGVPSVREDDARRALGAALGMLDALDRLNADLEQALGIGLEVRIGVNTGPVVAASDASARQALVSGETVNVAARLEQHADAGSILLGPETRLAAGPTVRVEEVGPLRLKGKSVPVTAYRLLGLGGDEPDQLRRFDIPFVGRGAELDALDAALARATGTAGAPRTTGTPRAPGGARTANGAPAQGGRAVTDVRDRGDGTGPGPDADPWLERDGSPSPAGTRDNAPDAAGRIDAPHHAAHDTHPAPATPEDSTGPRSVNNSPPDVHADTDTDRDTSPRTAEPHRAVRDTADEDSWGGEAPDGRVIGVADRGSPSGGPPRSRAAGTGAAGPPLRHRLLVHGEAGLGKTRLVRQWLATRAGPRVAYGAGRCRPYGDRGTLWPLADALTSLLAARRSGAAERDAADALAVLAGGLLADGTPSPSPDDTCAALLQVLTAAATGGPVVLVLDDCHWAAPALLDLVDRLDRELGDAPVLLLCLARPELLDSRAAPPGTTLALPGLPEADARLLAEILAGATARLTTRVGAADGRSPRADQPGADADAETFHTGPPEGVIAPGGGAPRLGPTGSAPGTPAGLTPGVPSGASSAAPPGLPDRLLERAGGNPLHLEQLLLPLPRGARADDPPPTVQALLGARIDALTGTERITLDLAAVLGGRFDAAELAELARGTRRGTVEALLALGRHRMVEPAADGRGYRFASGLVQEVAYGCMSKRARAERHERAADLPGVRARGDGAVGGHLERAYRYRRELGLVTEELGTLRLRAAGALGRAGAQALARSDLPWADDLLSRSTALYGPGDPSAAGALRRLGEVRLALGRVAEARELLRRTAAAPADPLELAHARLSLAVAGVPDGGSPAEAARRTLPVFEAAGDPLGQARACLRLGQHRQAQGRHGEADALLTRALAHAVAADAEPERAAALGAVGVSLWRGPEPLPTALDRCRALLAEHGRRPTVRVTLNCPLAVMLALRARPAAARARLAEAERLAERLGYAEARVFLPLFGALVDTLAGRGGRALGALDRAAREARSLGADALRDTVALESARVLLDQGRWREAAAALAPLSGRPGRPPAEAVDLDGLNGRLAAARGRDGEARELAARAVRAAADTDSPLVRALASLDLAHTLRALGSGREAVLAARAAEESFTAKGHLPGVGWARAVRLAGPARRRPAPRGEESSA
ncbi:adenylate/guanylate cyclase domain-containing protein [Streptomyces sp. NPDC052077]|uniref:adenylate/guanylate cyclase domain-containing protein n=1 Tax=Streptomyces sp. NPDC052077 TaxID=3154757 RepID=UPI003438C33D